MKCVICGKVAAYTGLTRCFTHRIATNNPAEYASVREWRARVIKAVQS